MSCLNLVFAVVILEIFSFVLIVQAIRTKLWSLSHEYIDYEYTDMQLLRRFASFYYCAMHSKNQIVSLCAKMCEHSKSIVASHRKYLLYQLNNNGSIF